MDIGSVSAALSSLKATYDLAKLAIAAHDEAKLVEVTLAFNERIMDVQSAALQLQERLSNTRDELDELKGVKRELTERVAEFEDRKRERGGLRAPSECAQGCSRLCAWTARAPPYPQPML